MTPEQKTEIDNMSYQEMLRTYCFAPIGDPMFSDRERGVYFSNVMARKRREVGDAAHTAASKAIGWGNK